MSNLTSVTSALQVAFDSTLLALFLSAALMLVQTLVFRRSEDLLARIDRFAGPVSFGSFRSSHANGHILAVDVAVEDGLIRRVREFHNDETCFTRKGRMTDQLDTQVGIKFPLMCIGDGQNVRAVEPRY
jgi:hypothetical protein